jgi:OOP family OmpA-OmpF porin
MADSLFASILNTLDTHTVGSIAGALGQSEHSVSRAMEAATATLLGGLASKSDDSNALRKVLDTATGSTGEVSWSQMASGITDPNSPLLAAGKRVLSSLFGNNESTVMNGISRESGLGPSVTSTLMAMAAPVVMSFISRRVRDTGLSMSGLGSLLQRESGTFRNALPAGLSDLFWPRAAAASASPVTTRTPVTEPVRDRSTNWLPALAIAGLALGLFWLLTHGRRTGEHFNSTGAASRSANEANRYTAPTLGDFVTITLPDGVTLKIPQNGVEGRLLGFIQNPASTTATPTWFNFDRLVFDTGSANLRPESQEQLNNVAAILKAYPNVNLKVGGYTDNVGGAERNLNLSRDRAHAVVTDLSGKGIASSRIAAEGYGQQHPVADNSTEEGRAQNRRIAMRVTQK